MRFASTRSKEDMLISKIVENSKNKTNESKQFYKTLIGSGFHTADRQTTEKKQQQQQKLQTKGQKIALCVILLTSLVVTDRPQGFSQIRFEFKVLGIHFRLCVSICANTDV